MFDTTKRKLQPTNRIGLDEPHAQQKENNRHYNTQHAVDDPQLEGIAPQRVVADDVATGKRTDERGNRIPAEQVRRSPVANTEEELASQQQKRHPRPQHP